MSDWKKRTMHYDPKRNIIYIDANESEFVPKFLDYLLEYYKIPANAKRVFLRDKESTDAEN